MAPDAHNGWCRVALSDLGTFLKGRGGPKSDDQPSGVPVVRYGELYTRHHEVIRKFYSFVSPERARVYSRLQPGDVLFAGSGETADEIGKAAAFIGPEPAFTAGDTVIFRPDKGRLDSRFIGYAANGPDAKAHKSSVGQGSSVVHIYVRDLADLTILLPPVPEQRRIAEILSSVDDTIRSIWKVIEQTKRVRRGLLQSLMTRGIGNTRLKETEIGDIPETWEAVELRRLVVPIYPEQPLVNSTYYRPVVIRRRYGGVECPVAKTGASILVKQQFKAVPDAFAISKRQIIHGACGIIPHDFPQNAIVSKEYLQLREKAGFHLPFLDLYAQTPGFIRSIERCTYGVDREKFVLNIRWFMQEKVPVPPLAEQVRIADELRRVTEYERRHTMQLGRLRAAKRGLMQDLLTGRVRVQPD